MEGFLIISDITGYTSYLSASELEHAEATLTSLLRLLIEHTQSPLVIAKLEGDAIFSYAPKGSFLQGQSLIEAIETTYLSFRQALELMQLNTSCTCNACRNISRLDLKFFVHFGSFIIQDLGAYSELLGTDVNLLHRLVKNQIFEQLDLLAYAVYTEQAVASLEIQEISARMHSHVESYESVGEVKMYVQDMHGVWERERERVRFVVTPQETATYAEHDFQIPAVTLWDYITKPEYRSLFMGADRQDIVLDENNRIGRGSIYYCAHGNRILEHAILDWQPVEQYTTRERLPLRGAYIYCTYRLVPIEGGTRLTISNSRVKGPWLSRLIGNRMMPRFVPGMMEKGSHALEERIRADILQGNLISVRPPEDYSLDISQAVKNSLESDLR